MATPRRSKALYASQVLPTKKWRETPTNDQPGGRSGHARRPAVLIPRGFHANYVENLANRELQLRQRRVITCRTSGPVTVLMFAILLLTTQASADPQSFFPSLPIHEDDMLSSEYHLAVDGCRFELTEFWPDADVPRRVTIEKVDLANIPTVPLLVGGSYGKKYSTRHIKFWSAWPYDKEEISALNSTFAKLWINFLSKRKLHPEEIAAKRERLREALTQIESGEFGDFAQRNHSVTYDVEDGWKIDSVSVLTGLRLPFESADSTALTEAVFQQQLAHCPEVVPRILDYLDGELDGKIDQFFLDKLGLEFQEYR